MSHVDDASILPLTWWKSSRSNTGAQCIECGMMPHETIAVRDSKAQHGAALVLPNTSWSSFVSAVKTDRFAV